MKYLEHLQFLKNINGIGLAKINGQYEKAIKAYDDFDVFADYVAEKEELSEYDVRISKQNAKKQIEMLEDIANISVVTSFDSNYPTKLNLLGKQKPAVIYCVGDIAMLEETTIAVIGTRKPSIYGVNANKKLVEQLKDVVVVSGLALGCDRIAHVSALQNGGRTAAVLPSGILNITPTTNRSLANEIAEGNGCIISEYGPDEPAAQHTYVRRDSLIAALSDSVIVIECGVKSGTMHTVNAAIKMDKLIACYYTDRGGDYTGNKMLIDEGKATQIMTPEEIRIIIDNAKANEASRGIEGIQMSIYD